LFDDTAVAVDPSGDSCVGSDEDWDSVFHCGDDCAIEVMIENA
jgi:hypothetical protein